MAAAATWQENAERWKEFYPSSDLQAEFFLLKFGKDGDLKRDHVLDLCTQFKKFDKRKQGELEEDEAMQILEARDNVTSFVELRKLVAQIDVDKNRKLSFLEWACAIYKKSWETLHSPSVDPREIEAAERLHAQAAAALEQAAADLAKFSAAEAEALAAKNLAEENDAEALARKIKHDADQKAKKEADEKKAADDEAEKQRLTNQGGVKGSAAKFLYAGKDTADSTMDNASRIKAEAAARKEKKRLEEEKVKAEAEAAKANEEAEKASALKAKADEEAAIAAEAAAAAEAERERAAAGNANSEAERLAYEEQKNQAAAAAAAKKAEEDAKRAESRARLAAKTGLWGGASP